MRIPPQMFRASADILKAKEPAKAIQDGAQKLEAKPALGGESLALNRGDLASARSLQRAVAQLDSGQPLAMDAVSLAKAWKALPSSHQTSLVQSWNNSGLKASASPARLELSSAEWKLNVDLNKDRLRFTSMTDLVGKICGSAQKRCPLSTREALFFAQTFKKLGPERQAALVEELATSNVTLSAGQDGRYFVLNRGKEWATTLDLAENKIRQTSTNGNQLISRVAYLRNNRLIHTIIAENGAATIKKGNTLAVWQRSSTADPVVNGVSTPLPQGLNLPGEAPRVPWAALPPNRYEELTGPTGSVVDSIVKQLGGKVVRPTQDDLAADVFNCHSFALTAGRGDIEAPFFDPSRPHWLVRPEFQLHKQGFINLGPSDKVQQGDVVGYWINNGLSHTGVVREVDRAGNPTLIESKWGAQGLFQHAPFDSPYGTTSPMGLNKVTLEFYRKPSKV